MKIIKEYIYDSAPQAISALNRVRKIFDRTRLAQFKLGFVVEEFFHEDLRGFGGYGMLVKNLAEKFNSLSKGPFCDVLLSSLIEGRQVERAKYHNTDVIFRAGHTQNYVRNFINYGFLVNSRDIDILVTVDWYQSYEYIAKALPRTPIIVWIQDPRSKDEWRNIATVPIEAKVIGGEHGKVDVEKIFERKHRSFQELVSLSKKYNRKLIFVTQAKSLVERARKAYGISDLEAEFLPNVIDIPEIDQPCYSQRPSLCLLGRLDPVKRPWIYFELAKRFPEIDFLVAGSTLHVELMTPIIEKYNKLSNLKFLGHIDGQKKQNLLNSVWALVNTSIHEALPVTFLESFAYGKPVVSSQNPDSLVSKYGYWTEESLGKESDEKVVDKFASEIKKLVSDNALRKDKGSEGYDYVRNNHSLDNFTKKLNTILKKEKFHV